MPYQKGQSGNPNGRPPKPRALAKLLETAGKKTIVHPVTKKNVSRKNLLAEMVWAAATEGKVTLPDGSVIAITEMSEMLTLWKFLHVHIDGPAKAEVDLTTANQPLMFNIMPAPPRPAVSSSEPDEDDDN